ncbi:hypothetical protein [Marinobacter sediminicola]|uniref:hypothetical protein n=1 Tax=Marinobacter sediminicola TaxID=3072994 RepID=UPI0028125E32|nr:hypothetical protein [Marinobacter sp. F26243]
MARDQRLVFSLQEGPGYIKGTQFTDVDLAGVSGYVVFLNLENADISDQGIRVLPELPELRGIDLDGTEVTDKAMERIAEFKNLEEIWIEGTSVSDVGFSCLHSLKNLRFISIVDCENISNEAIERLEVSIPGVEVH